MIKHLIGREDEKKLFKLKLNGQYRQCIDFLEKILENIGSISSSDELGWLYQRLSILYIIIGDDVNYIYYRNKALQIFQKEDVYAMSAMELFRSEVKLDISKKYCELFFEIIDDKYQNRDELSKVNYENMVELRHHFSKI